MCGSKSGRRRVTDSACRTRSRWLFEATQRGAGKRGEQLLDARYRPQLALERDIDMRRASSRRTRPAESARTGLSISAVKVMRFLPKPRSIASSIVIGKSAAIRHSPSTRPKMISLSISTPSQSKMTRADTIRFFRVAGSGRAELFAVPDQPLVRQVDAFAVVVDDAADHPSAPAVPPQN